MKPTITLKKYFENELKRLEDAESIAISYTKTITDKIRDVELMLQATKEIKDKWRVKDDK